MADDSQSTALEVAQSTRLMVESSIAIFDSAKFQHMGRIAAIMSDAGLMPETLTHEGKKGERNRLPDHIVKARAFLICAQADRWGMDPMAVMNCCAVVHNKLMYEGRLVNAVLEARIGVRLAFEFGAWDAKTERVMLGVDAVGDQLGVVVSATLPGETAPRSVEGFVGGWKTTGDGSPWTNVANRRRQLRYRGSREFANAHAPGLMLGVMTEDEIDDAISHSVATAAPLPQLDQAFGDTKARATRKPKDEPKPATETHDPETGEITAASDPNGRKVAPVAEEAKPSPASATDASSSTAAGTAGPTAQENHSPVGAASPAQQTLHIESGFALSDEVYHVANDLRYDAKDGKWQTFKNGHPFSRAAGKMGNRVYADHNPDFAKTEAAGASNAGEMTSKSPASSEGSPPSDDQGGLSPQIIHVLNLYSADVAKADSWLTIKPCVSKLRKADVFQDMDRDTKARAFLLAYNRAIELKDPVTPATDPAFYRLWLLQAELHEVASVHRKLIGSAAYNASTFSEADRDALNQETDEILDGPK